MKNMLILFAVAAALACASDEKAAAPAIPAGAVEVSPYTYRFTGAQGDKWLYRQTPFGVVKLEDKPAVAPIVDSANPVKFSDLGGSVKFERATPFGTQSWTRKKSELTDEETVMVKTAEKR